VDLEAVAEGFAHTQSNQWMSVDHKALWARGTQGSILMQPGPRRAVERTA
jgi:hypothetical protein